MRIRDVSRTLKPVVVHVLKNRLLIFFLALSILGIIVGLQARPERTAIPYAEIFREMRVVSYRELPSDTIAHFAVDLCAGGKAFTRYEVDGARFTAPPRDRDYNRAITGTVYRPLQLRGHVAQGVWLDVPRVVQPSLMPQQFDELYRASLDFVKPVSVVAGVVGMLSGYSVGYRIGTWNSSLRSHAVQERVLDTPGLSRVIAREAWRRVLLEPLVMGAEDDAGRLASTCATQRIYSNFFRLALKDSDNFIPNEAARLAGLGHTYEARTMLAFAEAVRRAKIDTVVTSADFDAIERWASLLVRRGHWAADAIPTSGEERVRYLGTLTWYGVEPPSAEATRIWVGSRLLVREGDTEGFVADEVPATGVGCPISWRAELLKQSSGTNAMATAWFGDHPEFRELATIATRLAVRAADEVRTLAARQSAVTARNAANASGAAPRMAVASMRPLITVVTRGDSSAVGAAHAKATADSLRAPAKADSVHALFTFPVRADGASADSTAF